MIGIFITSYNMPEKADALAEQVKKYVKCPHATIVVDNGSDTQPPAKNTTIRLSKNVQTTGGWQAGLNYAKSIRQDWFAYWFLITSAELPDGDQLSKMVQLLERDPQAVGIHPALTPDSTTSWEHLKTRNLGIPRQTWMIDNIASLYRADWFDSIGGFDPQMSYAWGIDLETCFKAREQGKTLWIDERVSVKKETNIGYKMDRMNMTASEREQKAGANMAAILSMKYGPNWWQRMTQENVTKGML